MDQITATVERIRANVERNRQARTTSPPSFDSGSPLTTQDRWLGFEATTEKLKLVKRRVAEFSNGQRLGLILAGNPGCGKTHLARVVELHWWLRSVLIGEPEMLARIQDTYRGNGSESAVIVQLRASPMLILDDVGAGHVTLESRTWLQGIYWRLIDRRAEHQLPLMVTTNLDFKQLGCWIGQRALDRLIGLCGTRDGYVDMFDVPSHRREAW